MSEEKQRILLLERVNTNNSCLSEIISTFTHLSNLLFQTLHMKEEENKRLSQRLVSSCLSRCAVSQPLH